MNIEKDIARGVALLKLSDTRPFTQAEKDELEQVGIRLAAGVFNNLERIANALEKK